MHALGIFGDEIAADGIVGAVCHHNGDWSGDAVIAWTEAEGNIRHEVTVPAILLITICKLAALDTVTSAMIGALENLGIENMVNPGKR